MSDEVEVFSDDEGAIVVGGRQSVEQFLQKFDLAERIQDLELDGLRKVLRLGPQLLDSASGIAEQSMMYLKLTPESAKRLRDSSGLMETKTKGISHAMLGKSGDSSLKWLQVDTKVTGLLTNPAILSGIGRLMSQFAQQAEAQELRDLLLRIEGRLDDVGRAQRDAVIARMHTAAAQIHDANTLRKNGGDPKTLWDKVHGAHAEILNVQEECLLALGSMAEKAQNEKKPSALKKATREIEREVAVRLAVLARCFELEDEFRVIELDHVMATVPSYFEGHRKGLAEYREQRRQSVLEKTQMLMEQLDHAGVAANECILLHPRVAQAVVGSLNATAMRIEEFCVPLGVEVSRGELSVVPWREAFRDPSQRKTAGREAGEKALLVAGAAGSVALALIVPKRR